MSKQLVATGKSTQGGEYEIQTVPPPLTPFMDGEISAASNEPFCPEWLWYASMDKAAYAEGYLSIEPDNACALAFMEAVYGDLEAERDMNDQQRNGWQG